MEHLFLGGFRQASGQTLSETHMTSWSTLSRLLPASRHARYLAHSIGNHLYLPPFP